LHVFDPQQIVDTASSLLADADLYSDAVLSHASSSIATVGTGSAVDVSAAALTVLADASSSPTDLASFSSPPEAGGITFSKASYYTVLGLYLLTFPGVWSTVKRSTTAKVKRKTFVTKGAASPGDGGKTLREQAGEIMACKWPRTSIGCIRARDLTFPVTARGVDATAVFSPFARIAPRLTVCLSVWAHR
jgi:hypothetical protein